ncbi:MAG: peptidoglycan binding domain-containing protein, partial [Butyricicoccaceae bacterium]
MAEEKKNPGGNPGGNQFNIETRRDDGSWAPAEPVTVCDAGAQPEQPEDPTAPVTVDTGWEDEPVRKKKGGSLKKVIAAAIAAIIVLSAGGLSAYVYTYDKIFPGVTIGENYKLSGMTQAEAADYIDKECSESILNSSVTLEVNGTEYSIPINKVAKTTEGTVAAQQAYRMGREGGFFQRVSTVFGCMFGGREISYDMSVDQDAVTKQVKSIQKKAYVEPVQPSFKV